MRHEPEAVERLDRALLSARRAFMLPEISALPLPELDRHLDPAKALACMAIADLADHDDTVTVKHVAAALTLEHSTASRLLADTEALGLVHRESDPQDRRRTAVTLTPTGQHVVEQLMAIRNWALSEVLADWEDEDLRRFAELIEGFTLALRANLDQVMQQAGERFSVGTGPDAHTPAGSSSADR